MICENSGHIVNTWTADDKDFLPNSQNLSQTIQMQLSKKQKTFSELVFAAFPKFTFNCKSFEKKNYPHTNVFSKLQTPKEVNRQMSEKPPRFRTISDRNL